MPTLLVVDDEPGIAHAFRRAYSAQGVEVVAAASGAEALSRLQTGEPDVVILDLQLPDGSGLEVFEAIRETPPAPPVIFLTAHGTTQTAIEAMKRGAFD